MYSLPEPIHLFQPEYLLHKSRSAFCGEIPYFQHTAHPSKSPLSLIHILDSLTAVIGENMMDKMAAMQNALEFLCENAEVTVVETTAAAEAEAE